MTEKNVFSVFTKPWMTMSVSELGRFVKSLGFDAIEFPVRSGYQVEPKNVARDLPKVAKHLADFGLRILSVAGRVDEPMMVACAKANIPIIRICVSIKEEGYMTTVAKVKKHFDALVPMLEKYEVTLGIQNHCDRCVCNAMGLRHLIEKYDPRHVCAVWDAGHNALNGEDPELAIDIIWPWLRMVNLKNAFWRRVTDREAEHVKWRPYWTTGRQGLASWPRVVAELKRRNWRGFITLCAEYSDEADINRMLKNEAVNPLIAEDIAFAKHLFK